MYGILVDSVRDSIIRGYGQHIWDQIEEYLCLTDVEILAKNIYPDELLIQVIDCLIKFRQAGDHDSYMEYFGFSFVEYFSHFGFEKILKIAGRSYRHFLYSIDQLHDSNRFTFPHMKSPLFFVDQEDRNGLFLHYQSRRFGFSSYIIGQLKEIGRRFYDIKVNTEIHANNSTDKYCYIIFRVEFDNKDFEDSRLIKSDYTKNRKGALIKLKSDTLLNLFPFSFGFDKDLNIKFVGSSLLVFFKDDVQNRNLYDVFNILRPTFKDDWDMIQLHSSSIIFEIETKAKLNIGSGNGQSHGLKIKGQMKYFKDWDLIMFLGHPVLSSMEELANVGLYLNDLNKFDGSAEMMVTELQHSTQLQKQFQAQQAFTENLEIAKSELNAWRKKGKRLLYSMLPARVASQIENGVQPNSICEVFDQVTILFVNTVNFGQIINNTEPAQIIKFINSTITVYDKIVATFDHVNKIETKADGSYMIVAGLEKEAKPATEASSIGQPSMISIKTTNEDESLGLKRQFPGYSQVELIAEVALDILQSASDIHNPFDDENDKDAQLQIKVGFHTGGVVAGIVGLSNIQFCLFGDTVNTSSRMCTNSTAGRALFSESAYQFLENSKHFETEFRDVINVKGKGEMKTFWLKGKISPNK